jgi:ABC-type anion transport system duplicated permease subunit
MMQTYRNHRRYVLLYHVLTLAAISALLIGSLVNLLHASKEGLYSAALLVLVACILVLLYVFVRRFPLKVQDRAIRAEENLRHFILTGKPLDEQLTMKQIIALRFASDEELAGLARRAVEEALNNDEIKREIKNWRADHSRA